MTLGIVYYGRLYRVRVCGRVRGGDHETDKKQKSCCIVLNRNSQRDGFVFEKPVHTTHRTRTPPPERRAPLSAAPYHQTPECATTQSWGTRGGFSERIAQGHASIDPFCFFCFLLLVSLIYPVAAVAPSSGTNLIRLRNLPDLVICWIDSI